jgi:hypothetical protein
VSGARQVAAWRHNFSKSAGHRQRHDSQVEIGIIDLRQFDWTQPLRCVDLRRESDGSLESGMKRSIVAGEPWAQPRADCAVHTHAICAALDQDELREVEQLGHRLQCRPNEPVFTQEEIVVVLEGVNSGLAV